MFRLIERPEVPPPAEAETFTGTLAVGIRSIPGPRLAARWLEARALSEGRTVVGVVPVEAGVTEVGAGGGGGGKGGAGGGAGAGGGGGSLGALGAIHMITWSIWI